MTELNLKDVGTRYEHYSQLLSLWESGLEILKKYRLVTEGEFRQLNQLETGIELLRKQIDVLAEFNESILTIKMEINSIPRDPSKIKGGRGTPLGE